MLALGIDLKKHDMTYSVRMCALGELDLLLEFIKNSWNENHIFIKDQHILDWQHRQDDCFNFVVAYHHKSNSFHGILGIVSPSFFSKGKIAKGDDIWLALWKVEKSKAEINSIGLDLLNYVNDNFSPRSVSAIGINNQVSMLYKLMGFTTGYLHQRFIINPVKNIFSIGNIIDIEKSVIAKKFPSSRLFEIHSNDLTNYKNIILQNNLKKNFNYLINRYINHPKYKYRVIGISDSSSVLALLVFRKLYVEESSCLRVIDGFGLDNITFSIKALFQDFLILENSEYVDFLCADGVNQHLDLLGFGVPTAGSGIPHLFEPFLRDPVKVHYAYKAMHKFDIFKGDSDLDRPNI